MSSIIYFDIRNFSTHFSHLSSRDKNKDKKGIIVDLIKNIFISLEKAIDKSRIDLGINRETFINHTGDGFVVILYDNERSVQSLFIASLISNDVEELIKQYNEMIKKETNLKWLKPLGYGIGIHQGPIERFRFHPEYPKNYRIYGFLGNDINASQRVQENTKYYKFQIICTKVLYLNAIKKINEEHKATFEKCFTKLDIHNLRGMSGSYNLYGVSIDFAHKIKPDMILNKRN